MIVDIFVNCIYLSHKIPSFVTNETITAAGPARPLRMVVDVSCDTTNPNNPIPVYNINTTFDQPTTKLNLRFRHLSLPLPPFISYPSKSQFLPIWFAHLRPFFIYPTTNSDDLPSLEVCSIDHLPTLLPREASQQFSNDLLPTLLQLKNLDQSKIWSDARDLFTEMVNKIWTGKHVDRVPSRDAENLSFHWHLGIPITCLLSWD